MSILPPAWVAAVPAPSLSQAELQLLLELGKQLVTELELEQVLARVAEMARQMVQAETLVVPMLAPDRQSYTYLAGSGTDAECIKGQQFDIQMGACGWVLRHERSLLFGRDHPMNITAQGQVAWQSGMASSLLVPLICRGSIIGGLSALGKQEGASFDARDELLLTLFANQASIAIDNARIFRELRTEKEKAQITLDSIDDGVLTTDAEANITYVNNALEQLTGLMAAELLGQAFDRVIHLRHEVTGAAVPNPVALSLQEGTVVTLQQDILLCSQQGAAIPVECVTSPLRDPSGRLTGTVVALHDVSAPHRLQAELEWQANYDALTNLGNRRLFNRRLEEALHTAHAQGRIHACAYLDLDQFKVVNDTCGHLVGDRLLGELAQRMQQKVRSSDLLARLGGDEFGLILFDCEADTALNFVHDIMDAVRTYRLTSGEQTFEVGVSIGLVPINSLSADAQQVMSHADVACYAAKEEGGNRVHLHTPSDLDLKRRYGEMQWVPRLRKVLQEGRFELYLQPIVPLRTDPQLRLHYEVLLRMRDEQGRIILPGLFLPAAERYRLMYDIDRWLIERVFNYLLAEMARPRVPGAQPLSVSVNLSGASVSSESFRRYLLARLAELQPLPAYLCFEITETVAVGNLVSVAEFLEKLHALGCHTALDDFGSGLCSFGYLKELPATYLKIDGKLIQGVGASAIDLGMIEAINQIGHLLGKQTVAECVEDETTLRRLRHIGVDYVQGYLTGRPRPWHEVCAIEAVSVAPSP